MMVLFDVWSVWGEVGCLQVVVCDIVLFDEDGYVILQRICVWEYEYLLVGIVLMVVIVLIVFVQLYDCVQVLVMGFQEYLIKFVLLYDLVCMLCMFVMFVFMFLQVY